MIVKKHNYKINSSIAKCRLTKYYFSMNLWRPKLRVKSSDPQVFRIFISCASKYF